MFSAPFKVFNLAAKDVWDDKANLILVNMVALVACLTVVFAPPAVFGLFYTANRLAAGESLGLTGLMQGGRKYFLQSWLWAIINVVVFLIVSVNLSFYERMPGTWGSILQYFFFIVLIVWLLVQLYALPYLMAMEEKKLLHALRSGWFTLMASPGYSLLLIVLVIAVILFSVALIFPFLLITPCLLACWGTRAVQERLTALGVHQTFIKDE
jgi:uncharacterized membrane protein YesL